MQNALKSMNSVSHSGVVQLHPAVNQLERLAPACSFSLTFVLSVRGAFNICLINWRQMSVCEIFLEVSCFLSCFSIREALIGPVLHIYVNQKHLNTDSWSLDQMVTILAHSGFSFACRIPLTVWNVPFSFSQADFTRNELHLPPCRRLNLFWIWFHPDKVHKFKSEKMFFICMTNFSNQILYFHLSTVTGVKSGFWVLPVSVRFVPGRTWRLEKLPVSKVSHDWKHIALL